VPLYNLATRRLEDTYPFITQVSKSSVNPDKWSFADGLGNPVYWFDGTASWASGSGNAISASWAATAGFSLKTKAAGIEWDIQLNSASATDGILGVAELGRGYYDWNAGAWTFGNRITGSAKNLVGSWSFHTNKDNYAIGDYSIAHGYKNIAGDSADSVEGYYTSTVNDTVTSLNLNFNYDSIAGTLTALQPGDFTTEIDALDLSNSNLQVWFYNSIDDILYPLYVPAAAIYDAGSDRTYFLVSGDFGSDDATGNGIIYYQSFSSAIKGEPLANHAEGDHTIAAGDASHAEGKYTWASAVGSHAEGLNTISSNSGSHAEGRNTQAKGDGSHAEGSDTIASGSSAHAEGYATLAQGEFSHAEGFYAIASGDASHAGGRETEASGYGARSIGYQTIASGAYSNAEGMGTTSIGSGSHAEGTASIASGSWSHAAGRDTIALGSYSYAGGLGTTAYYDGQTVVGRYNKDEGANDYFLVGDGNLATPSNAFGVNNVRMYASNSIYFPDLTDVFKPHIIVYDTGSGRIFYYTGSGLGGGGGSAISFYSGSTLLTASLNSLVITGSGITADINNGQVTMSFTGGGGTGTVGPGTVPYLAYFDSTNTITSNTIRYDVVENRYDVEGNSVDICNPSYNTGAPSPVNIIEPNAVSLQDDDGSNLYVNNIAPCSEQIKIPDPNLGRLPNVDLLKNIDINAIPCYGVKIDYSLILMETGQTSVAIFTSGFTPPAYTETGTILVTFYGEDVQPLTVNRPIGNTPITWRQMFFNADLILASEQYVYSGPILHDQSKGFQFAYEIQNDGTNANFKWYVVNDVRGANMYISFVTTILKYIPYP